MARIPLSQRLQSNTGRQPLSQRLRQPSTRPSVQDPLGLGRREMDFGLGPSIDRAVDRTTQQREQERRSEIDALSFRALPQVPERKPLTMPEDDGLTESRLLLQRKEQRQERKEVESDRVKKARENIERLQPLVKQASERGDFEEAKRLMGEQAANREIAQARETGIFSALSLGTIGQPRGEQARAARTEAEQSREFRTGELLGSAALQTGLYTGVAPILRGTQIGQRILGGASASAGRQIAGQQAADLFVDTVLQTPQEVIRGIQEDQTIGEQATNFLVNRSIDVLLNAAIGGATGDFKRAFQGEEVQQALKQADINPQEVIKAVDNGDNALLQEFRTKLQSVETPVTKEAVTPDFVARPDTPDLGPRQPLSERVSLAQEPVRPVEPGARQPFTERIGQEQTKQQLNSIVEEAPGVTTNSKAVNSVLETPKVGVSDASFVETVKTSDMTSPELKKELKRLELDTTSNEARDLVAQRVLTDNFENSVTLLKEGDQFSSAIEPFMGKRVIKQLEDQGRYDDAVNIIEKMAEKYRRAGQDVQSASVWALTTPEGVQKWATKTLKEANVDFDRKLIADIGDNLRTVQDMSPEELGQFVAAQIGKRTKPDDLLGLYSMDELKALNTNIAMRKVIDKIPILKAKKLSSVQAMSHLLNARTFSRNIVGNTASILAEQVSQVAAQPADLLLSAFSKNKSVAATTPNTLKQLANGWEQGRRSFLEIKAGANRVPQGKYDLLAGSSFKSKVGKAGEKVLAWSLQTPDEFFKGYSQAHSLYNQLQARLGKQVKDWDFNKVMQEATEQEIKTAADEAKFATFQNDSHLANVLSRGKKFLNEATAKLPGTVFTEDFGLGDLILKYTRVPGNIMTRGFEYSPLGYLKFMKDMGSLTGKELTPELQRQIAMTFGRATTGTGLLSLGAVLYNKGVISGETTSRDFDQGAFDRAEGLGNYKVNMDALGRMIRGEDTTAQSGDEIVNYNWLQPVTTPIAVGAQLAEKGLPMNADALSDLTVNTFEQAIDLPSMYTINKMFYEMMKSDSTPYSVAAIPVQEALPGFVPSIVRQTAQTLDPVVRDPRGGATVPVLEQLGEVGGKIQANIPGLSQQLPAKIDPLGQEMKRAEGPIANLLSPATQTTFKPTEFGEQLRKISELSGETSVFPDRKPPNVITFRGNKLELTQDEKQQWQRTEGQVVNELFSEFLKGKQVENEAKAIQLSKVLNDLKKRAGERAKQELLQGRFQ